MDLKHNLVLPYRCVNNRLCHLDGFDFGVGILSFFAHDEKETTHFTSTPSVLCGMAMRYGCSTGAGCVVCSISGCLCNCIQRFLYCTDPVVGSAYIPCQCPSSFAIRLIRQLGGVHEIGAVRHSEVFSSPSL